MRGKKGTKKDRFADLDSDFKDTIANMKEPEIRDRLAKLTLDQEALMELKKNDQDLAAKREQASEAGRVYREGTKRYKLAVAYARSILDAMGKPSGESGVE
jgi:hypothetical protein